MDVKFDPTINLSTLGWVTGLLVGGYARFSSRLTKLEQAVELLLEGKINFRKGGK